MLKTSRESAAVEDFGPVVDRHMDGEGQTIEFVEFREDIDSAPLLKGKVTFSDGAREEVFEPGDAFYVAPGHLQKAEGGTELLQFSPTEQMKIVEATIMKNMQAMSGG